MERTTATPAGAHEIFSVCLTQRSDGRFVATCDGPVCLATGANETEVLDKIRNEIRYRIELCPCTGVEDDYVQLKVRRGDQGERLPS